MTVTTKLLAQELTKDLQCFFDWAFHSSVVPEDHIHDSDQSSTLAGCSACCDHATTSENTEDQV
ncbi:hypothetical protein OsJ_31701 [Oryza sativa Japonica Group]|uniref:Uncharacterized protein n=1 Tax=Oryza sativa subsp. japonica TaxID=39947 RepID=B9G5Z8_ORYSJ|nr:hypothetical protein OsJ_31701 [Oryza sativa Japonica Group]